MKKILFVLALGAFASCTDATTDSETTTDSANVVVPEATAPAVPDSTTVPADSTVAPAPVVE